MVSLNQYVKYCDCDHIFKRRIYSGNLLICIFNVLTEKAIDISPTNLLIKDHKQTKTNKLETFICYNKVYRVAILHLSSQDMVLCIYQK